MSDVLKNRFSSFYHQVAEGKAAGFYSFFRPFETKQETVVRVKGKDALMFGSNSYLGLTTDPRVMEASAKALEKYGTSCAGSRFLNGTTILHEELEEKLARFFGKESVLLFSTGFQVNLGAIPALTRQGDYIVMDRLNHASIFEGARLSEANSVVYRHNDMASLEKKLQRLNDAELKFIVFDGIFSMEGNIANLPEIVKLAKKYNATIMTDCAHAVGVIGDHGRGTANHFNLTNEVGLIGGTFSKSLASLGGFIAGDKEVINHLRHHARSLIFSASMTPASTAAALASLDIIQSDDSLRLKLWENTNYCLSRLKETGFDIGDAETPIIPIYIRDDYKAYAFTARLLEYGVFVNPVVAPAVPPSESLIRFSLMASHSFDQIDQAIEQMVKVAKELGIHLIKKAA